MYKCVKDSCKHLRWRAIQQQSTIFNLKPLLQSALLTESIIVFY